MIKRTTASLPEPLAKELRDIALKAGYRAPSISLGIQHVYECYVRHQDQQQQETAVSV